MTSKPSKWEKAEKIWDYYSYILRFRVDSEEKITGEIVNVETKVSHPFSSVKHLHELIDRLIKK